MSRRRVLQGRPLLVAAGGFAVASACTGPTPPVGNLVAPPQIDGELCVDVVPQGATVKVNGEPATQRCAPVHGYEGAEVTVDVSAPGFVGVVQHVTLAPKMDVKVELTPQAPPPPVGNLMPPPRPPDPKK